MLIFFLFDNIYVKYYPKEVLSSFNLIRSLACTVFLHYRPWDDSSRISPLNFHLVARVYACINYKKTKG